VDTRIRKLIEGQFDAIILTKAGLNRLELTEHIKYTFTDNELIPSVCQGTLGIEIRCDDDKIKDLLAFLKDPATETVTKSMKEFLKKLEGGCQAPIGGFCTMDGDKLLMKGFISSLDGKEFLLYTEQESSKFPENWEKSLQKRSFKWWEEDSGYDLCQDIRF